MISDDNLRKAWARIACTADGQLIYLDLQKLLCSVFESNDGSALLRHDGRRSLARDLMAKMAEGIEARGGQSADPNDRPVTFAVSQPSRARPEVRGTRRRVSIDDHVEGWDRPKDDSHSTAKN